MSEDSERLVRELEREQHKGGGLFFTARDPRTGRGLPGAHRAGAGRGAHRPSRPARGERLAAAVHQPAPQDVAERRLAPRA